MRPTRRMLKGLALWTRLALALLVLRQLPEGTSLALSQLEDGWWGLGGLFFVCALIDAWPPLARARQGPGGDSSPYQALVRPAQQAAQGLMDRHRKRSLVILISNIREEDSEDLIAAIRLLSKRHRVVIASLRENFWIGSWRGR